MYRIYGYNKQLQWEKIDTKKEREKIYKIAENLSSKDYYSYVIIVNNGNGDDLVEMKDLTKECEIEYVDEVKTEYEVKATTFKPSRMKRKQEERRMFEQYIDR